MKFLTSIILLTLMSSQVYSSDTGLAGYDIDNKVEHQDFTFLPIFGSNSQGAFLYSKHKKVLLGPADAGYGWRSVAISLLPTAMESDEFTHFIYDNGIIDTRVNLIPPTPEPCTLTEDIKSHFHDLNLIYTTTHLRGGYPRPCTIIIKYLLPPSGPTEAAVLDLLQDGEAVRLSYFIGTGPVSTTHIHMHAIVDELDALGVVSEAEERVFTGARKDIVQAAAQLSPTLFGASPEATDISTEAWDAFLNAFIDEQCSLTISLTEQNETVAVVSSGRAVFSVDATL